MEEVKQDDKCIHSPYTEWKNTNIDIASLVLNDTVELGHKSERK